MRVVVVGSNILIRKLSLCLSSANIEALYCSDQFKLAGLMRKKKFDIALVDPAVRKSQVTCRLIRELQEIPIALIVSREHANWGKCQTLDPDGYIFDTEKKRVLIARLWAMVCRYYQINRKARMKEDGNEHIAIGTHKRSRNRTT